MIYLKRTNFLIVALLLPLLSISSFAADKNYGLFTLDNISAEYNGRQLSKDQYGLMFESRWASWLKPSVGVSFSTVDKNFQGLVSLKTGFHISFLMIYIVTGVTAGTSYVNDHEGAGVDIDLSILHLSVMMITSVAGSNNQVHGIEPGFDLGWNF